MARLNKEVVIKAPLEEIFVYISDPRNMVEIWPSLIEVTDVKQLLNGGYSFHWVYKMAGMRFEGKGECTRMVRNQFFVVENKGGIVSSIAWTVRSREHLTRVTLTIDYKVPVPLLGKLAEAMIVRMNDQEGDLMMSNLKARFMPASP